MDKLLLVRSPAKDESLLLHWNGLCDQVCIPKPYESMVALWLDVVPFWGHSLMVCMGVNREGYRRVLGFVEASLKELDVLRHLIKDVVDRGLCVEAGLLWIVPGPGEVSHLLTEWFGPQIRVQHCQVQKCRRVSRALAEPDQGQGMEPPVVQDQDIGTIQLFQGAQIGSLFPCDLERFQQAMQAVVASPKVFQTGFVC